MRIYDIESPSSFQHLKKSEYKSLCTSIRSFLIDNVSKTGGYLSKNLSAVEATVAMHTIFSAKDDIFLFDSGQLTYTHKLLTGRAVRFGTLRKYNGLSDQMSRTESVFDKWDNGHEGNAVAASLGFALSRDTKKENHEVVVLFDQDALTSGSTLEALQSIGHANTKVILVFLEYVEQPSKNPFDKTINAVRMSKTYQNVKGSVKQNIPSHRVLSTMNTLKDHIKDGVMESTLFHQFHLGYMGPIDGHNLSHIQKAFENAKQHKGSSVIHLQVNLGRGYSLVSNQRMEISAFDANTGRILRRIPTNQKDWSDIVCDTLIRLSKNDPSLFVIHDGKMNNFGALSYDYHQSYQQAITMANAMALDGMHPFVSIPSTYVSRALDACLDQMGRSNANVVIGIYDAGFVGEKGSAYHGIYDISFLRTIPNVTLLQPKDSTELQSMLASAFTLDGPVCIRYPKGIAPYQPVSSFTPISPGLWTRHQVGENPACIVITYGTNVDYVIHHASQNELDMIVVNARSFKPLDTQMLRILYAMELPIYVYESDAIVGGLSDAISEVMDASMHVIGIEDHYVSHGSLRSLRRHEQVHIEALLKDIENHG